MASDVSDDAPPGDVLDETATADTSVTAAAIATDRDLDYLVAAALAEAGKTESARFQADIDFLRGRGCRCPLMWDGVMAKPATACDLSGSPRLCAQRLTVTAVTGDQ